MNKYYQVILTNGKNFPTLYKSITSAISKVGIKNIKNIKEIRPELVNTKYLEETGKLNLE